MATKAAQTRAKSKSAQPTLDETAGTVMVNIREARNNLPLIVRRVAEGTSSSVTIGKRGEPTAAIVSYEFLRLLRGSDKKRKLAALIVEDLLAEAPLHLRSPAVDELSRLPKSDLDKLWRLEALPVDQRQRTELRSKLAHPEVFDRLVQRFDVAMAIKKARAAGLYEVAEDAASRLAFDAGSTE